MTSVSLVFKILAVHFLSVQGAKYFDKIARKKLEGTLPLRNASTTPNLENVVDFSDIKTTTQPKVVLETWHIVLIGVGSAALLIILIGVTICCVCKNTQIQVFFQRRRDASHGGSLASRAPRHDYRYAPPMDPRCDYHQSNPSRSPESHLRDMRHSAPPPRMDRNRRRTPPPMSRERRRSHYRSPDHRR